MDQEIINLTLTLLSHVASTIQTREDETLVAEGVKILLPHLSPEQKKQLPEFIIYGTGSTAYHAEQLAVNSFLGARVVFLEPLNSGGQYRMMLTFQ